MTTGELLRSAQADAMDPRGAVASDGWLYARSATDGDDAEHRRAIDLLGHAGSGLIGTLPHTFVTMAGRGATRIAPDRAPNATPPVSALTALDARKQRQVWSAASHVSGDILSSAHGATLVQLRTSTLSSCSTPAGRCGSPKRWPVAGSTRARCWWPLPTAPAASCAVGR